ncbi:MAG: acyltransferase family protein [Saprospiraceae bacterium]
MTEKITINKLLPQRLASLDALRGFDMLWIIGADELFYDLAKVSDNGFFNFMAKQLTHPDWHGFAAYDVIFPLFLFIAGVATPYSIGSQLEKGVDKQKLLLRVIKRGLLLVLLGIIYNNGLTLMPIEKIRFASVLGRIGLAWMFANIIYLYAGKKAQVGWFAGLLIGYWLLLKFNAAPGFPAGDLTMEGNFASYVDRLLLPGHLYLDIHDPEGLFSTIPAISTGLLGILTGSFLKNSAFTPSKKAVVLFVAGVISVLLAQLWNLDFPINKNLWTSSFALQAGGISLMLLALFYYVIDVLGYQKWAFFFRVIGLNSILIYLSTVFIDWHFTAKAFFGWLAQLAGTTYGVAVIILCIIAIKWVFLYFMYKQKWFLRI